jgi:hypothetical protein
MTDDFNPYAAPAVGDAELAFAPFADGGVWRDGYTLMMAKGATLPQRCLKCNAPTDHRLFRRLSWHPPAVYVILAISPLVYVIVALIVQKRAKAYYPVCLTHLKRRRWAIAIGWFVSLLSIPVLVAAFAWFEAMTPVLLLIGGVLFTGGIIGGVLGGRIVKVHKIDKWFVWLEGLDLQYLESLEPLPAAPSQFNAA